MGAFRLLLACIVLGAHISLLFFNAPIAIESFFVISGFYIAYVLQERYHHIPHAYLTFLASRFLRIYPTYWAILIPMSIIFLRHIPLVVTAQNIPHIIQNIFLFPAAYYFTATPVAPYDFMVGPAWTLGLELLFYVIAPLFVRSPKKIMCFLSISALGKILFPHIPFWAEFFFFVLGTISYLIYRQKKNTPSQKTIMLICICILTPGLLFSTLPSLYYYTYFFTLTLFIPLLFSSTKKNSFDRLVAELSYPLYICQPPIFHLLRNLRISNFPLFVIAITVSCFCVAILLTYMVDIPIQKYKYRLFSLKKSS